jgi:hypothetical protein
MKLTPGEVGRSFVGETDSAKLFVPMRLHFVSYTLGFFTKTIFEAF